MSIPRSTTLLVVLLGVILGALAPRASAQGTSNILPDPIASADLDTYAAMLTLSAEQRLAADRPHVAYLKAFDKLRDREIQVFLVATRVMMGRFMMDPDVAVLKDTLKTYAHLQRRISTLDRQLFDVIAGLLSTEQQTRMDRVRRYRERQRLMSGLLRAIGRGQPGMSVDLAEAASALSLSAEELPLVESITESYERRFTNQLQSVAGESEKLIVALADRAAALLAEQQDAENVDPARMGGMFSNMRNWMTELSGPTIDAVESVTNLNRRTYRELHQVLSPTAQDGLTKRYLGTGYSDVLDGAQGTMSLLYRANAISDFDDAQRQSLREIGQMARERHLRVADRMIVIVDAQRRERINMRFNRGNNEQDDPLDPGRARQQSIEDDTAGAILALAGLTSVDDLPTLDAAFAAANPTKAGAAILFKTAMAKSTSPKKASNYASFTRIGDAPTLPAAIYDSELIWYTDQLGVAPDDRMLAEAMHGDYLAAWSIVVETDVAAYNDVRSGLWKWDRSAGGMQTPSPETLRRLTTLRDTAIRRLQQLDEQLISDIALTTEVDPARTLRTQRSRQRVVHLRPPPGMRRGRSANPGEAEIDLSILVWQLLAPDVRRDLDAALLAYEEAMTSAVVERYERRLQQDRQLQLSMAEGGGRWNRGTSGENDRERSQLEKLNASIVELNQSTLDALRQPLSAALGTELLRRYRSTAYPKILGKEPVEELARRMLALEDIDTTQRAEIAEILAEYRPNRSAQDDRLIELDRERRMTDGRGRQGRGDRMDWAGKFQRIEFTRREHGERTTRQLLALLSESQRAQVSFGKK